jgi:hypothetical protein
MDEEPDTVEVKFTDQVNVAMQGHGDRVMPGMLFGDWYVMDGIAIVASYQKYPNPYTGTVDPSRFPPHSRFMVGHNPSGLAAVAGLEFWDAIRIARAFADADPEIVLDPDDLDPDFGHLTQAIIASALMDHYVFPITGWSV